MNLKDLDVTISNSFTSKLKNILCDESIDEFLRFYCNDDMTSPEIIKKLKDYLYDYEHLDEILQSMGETKIEINGKI